jgi:hypothetical protein
MGANFHAIADWTLKASGQAFLRDRGYSALHVVAFAFGSARPLHRTRRAYREAAGDFGPADQIALYRVHARTTDARETSEILAMLRLSRHSIDSFLSHYQELVAALEDSTPQARREVVEALDRVWDNHYALSKDDGAAFYLGVAAGAAGAPATALRFFETFKARLGTNAALEHNLKVALGELGRSDVATAAAVGGQSG